MLNAGLTVTDIKAYTVSYRCLKKYLWKLHYSQIAFVILKNAIAHQEHIGYFLSKFTNCQCFIQAC